MSDRGGLKSIVRAAAGTWLLSASAACSTAVASDLPESEANRAVVALENHGVSAEKERDPETEGRFRVNVGRDEAASAAAILSREALPSSPSPGILESLGGSSVVPSRLSEHARLLSGISGELETSLRGLDGVVSARVHVAAPERTVLDGDEVPSRPSASVLIRHRGANAPIAASEVQRLVAGAVPGLDAAAVSVVVSPATASGKPLEKDLRRVGPITVTRASLSPLRALAGGVVLLNLGLLATVLLLWMKARRAEQALGQARATAEADAASR